MKYLSASGMAAALILAVAGCENLPGTKGQQGAVAGGVAGAATGAAVGGGGHRLLGALLGGAVGAGGGYLIGANVDKITGHNHEDAARATADAQRNPATPEQARAAATADLNGDGFVTMDEIVAMQRAGFSDTEMLNRLRATGQVFELTDSQRRELTSSGVSSYVVNEMESINRQERDRLMSRQPGNDVISRPGQ